MKKTASCATDTDSMAESMKMAEDAFIMLMKQFIAEAFTEPSHAVTVIPTLTKFLTRQ
jgi:hypothetical protein